jgi:hypothetical protein
MQARIERRLLVAFAAIASLAYSGSIQAACPPGTTAVAGQGCAAPGSAAAPAAPAARPLAPSHGSAVSPAPNAQVGPLVPGAAVKPAPLLLKCELAKSKAPYQYHVLATNLSGARLPASYQVQWQVKLVQLPAKKGTYLLSSPMPAGVPVTVASLSSLTGMPTSCTAYASVP